MGTWYKPQNLTLPPQTHRHGDILWRRLHNLRFGRLQIKHAFSPCCRSLSRLNNSSIVMRIFVIPEKYPTIGPTQFVLTFELRPQRLTGLLFHVQSHQTSLSVYLKETEVKPLTVRTDINTQAFRLLTVIFTRWALKFMMVMWESLWLLRKVSVMENFTLLQVWLCMHYMKCTLVVQKV